MLNEGAKVLTASMVGVHTGRSKQSQGETNKNETTVLSNSANTAENQNPDCDVEVGFYRSPEQWFRQACLLDHPIDVGNPIAKVTFEALRLNIYEDAKVIELKRKTALLKAQIEAKKPQEAEQALHDSMPSYMRKVMVGKKILLYEALLKQYGYDDLDVVKFLRMGVDLTGSSECPDCFERRVRLASRTRLHLPGRS